MQDVAIRSGRLCFALQSLRTFSQSSFLGMWCGNLVSNTSGTLRAIAKFLGVQIAEDKDVDFSMTTDLLGVTVDLSDEFLDEVRVCNKLERKKDLSKALGEIIHSRRINPMQIPSLFGRLQFAESQILGRAGGLALKFLRKLENMNVRSVELQDEQGDVFFLAEKAESFQASLHHHIR